MKKDGLLRSVIENAPNRRAFLAKVGMASAALAGATQMGKAQSSSGPTDFDILNFALNLEYVESEFYTVATTGMRIEQLGIGITGSGNAGPTTGGSQVNFGSSNSQIAYSQIANEIAFDERAHVSFIRAALISAGVMPVAKPAINLGAAGIGFGGITDFLQLARIFEDIGVTAYAGAAPLLSSKAILGYAARIAQTEAEHSSSIRLQMAMLGIPSAAIDGVDIIPPPSGVNYFPLDSNGLTQTRTTGQVLYLAYGNSANATSGGFFPNGVNGTINMSSTAATNTAANGTAASVTPATASTSQSSIVLDASASTSGSGSLTYLFMVLPGGKVPAVLQTPNNPKATIQFVNGPGVYLLELIVTDASGVQSTANITLTYTGM
jgi:hypothetical protein